MTVTEYSKRLGNEDSSWAESGAIMPSGSYEFRVPYRIHADALQTGEELHEAFSEYADGKWVSPRYYGACRAIEEALSDMDVYEVDSEVSIRSDRLSGKMDLYGRTNQGRAVIVEVKTTLGEYALRPRSSEVVQLATYASILDVEDPLLACLRVSMGAKLLNVYRVAMPRGTSRSIELAPRRIEEPVAI